MIIQGQEEFIQALKDRLEFIDDVIKVRNQEREQIIKLLDLYSVDTPKVKSEKFRRPSKSKKSASVISEQNIKPDEPDGENYKSIHDQVIESTIKLIRHEGQPVDTDDIFKEVKKIQPKRSAISVILSNETKKVEGARIVRTGFGLYGLPGVNYEKEDKEMEGGENKFMTQEEQIAYAKEHGLTEQDIKDSVEYRRVKPSATAGSHGKSE